MTTVQNSQKAVMYLFLPINHKLCWGNSLRLVLIYISYDRKSPNFTEQPLWQSSDYTVFTSLEWRFETTPESPAPSCVMKAGIDTQ